MRFEAPAKVNLFLYVLGRREDGYHDLLTRMQKIDLCDILDIDLNDSGRVECSCSDKTIPTDENNLAVRAAELFFRESRQLSGSGVHISLEKNIPVAAGLGGGSSDAGTVLRALNDLAGKEFSDKELIKFARGLGADVPFFSIDAPAVIAGGIGDLMYPVDSLENYEFLLVNPGFSVSTAEIFRKIILTSAGKKSKLARLQQQSFNLQDMHNDLESISFALYPQIENLKQTLREVGARQVLMSGSGGTVFGVFAVGSVETDEKCSILEKLQAEYGSKVFWSKVYWGVAKR
ncbi:4-(cytidine 5'-diphospho)-2-C-methyl-D-erythritol kinase [Desulforhopalus vacuolatus]|uniref:4-(cytidine 5'-diphospho)-2-C-methyl-D-erythritol kinase n=1 Tax=Desulforhopalus vacuolatus TaxID=40414 RepID=UPI001965F743|nr:4-(cytidine 5'-diphospho)-2-C-methyl-D-erythritol kinase [Desulforhopalus vacuolatus]MBM9520008.1 4-(cytidine 5'-diphospho)-2-C-methyl-D-erythritol kinase [Desulforhopalus vacuolatus]